MNEDLNGRAGKDGNWYDMVHARQSFEVRNGMRETALDILSAMILNWVTL